jgi:hypothetical protein
MICPDCGSSEVRTSRRTRWSDIFQRVRGREAFRCRKCRLRFFASASTQPDPLQAGLPKHAHRPAKLMSYRSKKRLIRRLTVIAIFAVAFMLFWFFLRHITTEQMPPSDSGAIGPIDTESFS